MADTKADELLRELVGCTRSENTIAATMQRLSAISDKARYYLLEKDTKQGKIQYFTNGSSLWKWDGINLMNLLESNKQWIPSCHRNLAELFAYDGKKPIIECDYV